MSKSFVHSSLSSFVLCAALVLVSASAQTQRGTGSADARLRALYTEEWNWRQQDLARGGDQPRAAGAGDRFPKVDAASQQARLPYWTRTLTTLDSVPFDELSAEEKVNAQVFRTYEAPFNSDTFFWTEFTPRQGFATAGAYRAFLAGCGRRLWRGAAGGQVWERALC